MPSAFRNPKNLADWLRLDYFRYPRRLPWLFRWLCWSTLLACVGGVGAAMLLPREPQLYEAGPLSSAHGMLNNDCGHCHRENFATAQRFLPWKQNVSSVPDEACTKCHQGPLHSDKLLVTEACVSCHQEHRGHEKLARVPDSRCESCHRDIKANSKSGADCPLLNVRAFPGGHPEFRGLEKDTGTIKFNHAKHLNLHLPGFSQLQCAECHQPDNAGRYMQPISYLSHCSRCHPLSVQLGGTFEDTNGLKTAAEEFAKKPAPHVEPALVRGALRERLMKFTAEHPLQALELPAEVGGSKPSPKSSLDAEVTKEQWGSLGKLTMSEADRTSFVRRQQALSEQLCFDRAGGCALCHTETTPRALGRDLPSYAKSDLPTRWFPRSRFDHRPHRMLDCVQCHTEATTSTQASDRLMPGLQTCARCHNGSAGARSDCLECHIYHPRDHGKKAPLQRTIDDVLRK
jgi:hypothetical protein